MNSCLHLPAVHTGSLSALSAYFNSASRGCSERDSVSRFIHSAAQYQSDGTHILITSRVPVIISNRLSELLGQTDQAGVSLT
jgi:hypothetical protein